MQLFYNPHITDTDSEIIFDKDESRHISKVLRKKVGDTLHITNGQGWLFNSEIVSSDLKKCRVKIVSRNQSENRNYSLHMAVAPTKMNDRYEWFLEKATEIGVDSITPIITSNSERLHVKIERFDRIIQSALKQSLQVFKPLLNEAMSLEKFLGQEQKGQLFIAHCEDGNEYHLKNNLNPKTDVTILIGPEGDFTSNEIKMAMDVGFSPISLGETRLRTETAAIVACTAVALANE